VIDVPKSIYPVLYVLLMVALIVGVDVLFLRNQSWLRLVLNIGIVLVFVVFYLTVLRNR
jgi:hypothetical protein